jgi:hypothetical protein
VDGAVGAVLAPRQEGDLSRPEEALQDVVVVAGDLGHPGAFVEAGLGPDGWIVPAPSTVEATP